MLGAIPESVPVAYLVIQVGNWSTGSDDVGSIQSTKSPKVGDESVGDGICNEQAIPEGSPRNAGAMQLCPSSASQCVQRGLQHNTCTAVCCQTSCKVQLSVNGKDASLSRHQDVKCRAQHPDQRPAATLPFSKRQTAGRAAEGRKGKDGCSAQSGSKGLHLGQLGHADRSCRALRPATCGHSTLL